MEALPVTVPMGHPDPGRPVPRTRPFEPYELGYQACVAFPVQGHEPGASVRDPVQLGHRVIRGQPISKAPFGSLVVDPTVFDSPKPPREVDQFLIRNISPDVMEV